MRKQQANMGIRREMGIPFGSNSEDRLRYAGLRATLPRVAVYAFLRTSNKPVSLQEIIRDVGKKVDQVTVYRILETFKKLNITREIDLRQGRPLYELSDHAHDHHHVVCTNCNRVEDFTGCQYEKIASDALKQVRGFAKIESHSLELFGMCNACITK